MGTRYGFLVTAEELVAVRVFYTSASRSANERCGLQYKLISWNAAGLDSLKMNLAVWALAMMGVVERERPIVFGADKTKRIDAWDHILNPQTGKEN